MISKILYSSFLFLFVYCFASTTQLPRLIYQNFIAPAAAAQHQPATGEATNQPQKIKRATTGEARAAKQVIMPPDPQQVSTPKPAPPQTPAQLGFLFAVSLLNLFIGFKVIRWTYRTFLQTPLYLIITAVKFLARFLILKPYRYLTTPEVLFKQSFVVVQ
jgi:hypothetical protein